MVELNARLSAADVHVHSRYSDRPSEWILRRIGSPESFVEPLHIYETARARGMGFVTISDHNCIQGALDIAHLPNTFISTEVTTYFPEDGSKIHCLVLGITEEQFEVIQEVRRNIYEFQKYVVAQNIIHSVAHPLFRVNGRLTIDQVEKLILLFKRFEAINGTRDQRACQLANIVLNNLTPEVIYQLAEKHGIEPLGPEPWVKFFTAGSDDHSGMYIGRAHTVTARASTVEEFLQSLREGSHEPAGSHGTSLVLAHCFYHIGYSFYQDRLVNSTRGHNIVGELFRRLLEEPQQKKKRFGSFATRVRNAAHRFFRNRKLKKLSDVERTLVEEFSTLFGADSAPPRGNGYRSSNGNGNGLSPAGPLSVSDQETFEHACRIAHMLSFAFMRQFDRYVREGRLVDSLQTIASLGPVALSIAPYLASFKTQHKDEKFLQRVASAFDVTSQRFRSGKKAWLTDTFTHGNGVARTIRRLARTAHSEGRPLTVVTCCDSADAITMDVKNFEPVGTFPIPEYGEHDLAFPPFLDIIEYLEREKFSEIIISTPGPMGVLGVLAAKLLGLRTVGIYHTDFPAYVLRLTDQDRTLEQLTWRFLHWFYDQMDTVFVPNESYRQHLIQNDFSPEKLLIMKRGVDLSRFSPERRTEGFWRARGLDDAPTVAYVGGVSKEKNLDALIEAHRELARTGLDVNLAIVGDGPYLKELRRRCRNTRILFTGFLEGEELSRAYASADTLVFPSTTDTFGSVVLEAQASGVPVIVSDGGGPSDIIRDRRSGIVIDVARPAALSGAIRSLVTDEEPRQSLRERGIESAGGSSWNAVLEHLWSARTSDQEVEQAPRDRNCAQRSTGPSVDAAVRRFGDHRGGGDMT